MAKPGSINAAEIIAAGGNLSGLKAHKRGAMQPVIDSYVCRILGILHNVPGGPSLSPNQMRMQILEKARRLVGAR